MANYLVVDTTLLVRLAKADPSTHDSSTFESNPGKGQLYLNLLLESGKILVITDTVAAEATLQATTEPYAAVIRRFIDDYIIATVPTGIRAGLLAECDCCSFENGK